MAANFSLSLRQSHQVSVNLRLCEDPETHKLIRIVVLTILNATDMENTFIEAVMLRAVYLVKCIQGLVQQ